MCSSSGQVCSAGACTTVCGTGLTNCSGACVDLTSDPFDCGKCGNTCPTADQNDVLTFDRIADGGLAVAIIAAGVTTWLVLSSSHDDARSSVWLGASPLIGGASATLGARF